MIINQRASDILIETALEIVYRCKLDLMKLGIKNNFSATQFKVLKEYVITHDLLIPLDIERFTFLTIGSENDVFYDEKEWVLKLNNFDYINKDLCTFFERIKAHNYFFSKVPYYLQGFALNTINKFSAVLLQPYIRAQRMATKEEIKIEMKHRGFKSHDDNEFYNEEYTIFDIVPENVLLGKDKKLYFIDTQIHLRNQ